MTQFHPFLPLHPLLPGTMRGVRTLGLKKQFPSSKSNFLAVRSSYRCVGPTGIEGVQPLVEYGEESAGEQKCIRHLSINRAKGLDSLAVIMIGVWPFQNIRNTDGQYTYFMGASRAKQLLGIVHG